MAKKPKRDDELSGSEEFDGKLLDILNSVEKGFQDQQKRANEIHDNWDMYNQVLGDRQFYAGESKIYLPFVHDAVEAQVTRYTNQLFPGSGKNVQVIASEEDLPSALASLLESYIRKTKLRTQVCPALIRNGQIEGQYSIYVDWTEVKRNVVQKVSAPVLTNGLENPAADEVEDIEEDEIVEGMPLVEVIADNDLCVLPATSDSIDEALAVGGSVTVVRRWTKGKIKQMAKEGHIRQEAVDELVTAMDGADTRSKPELRDQEKDNATAAGIKGRGKHVLIYETWARVKIGKGKNAFEALCRIYYGGDKRILGCKQNPFWNDRCPIISAPVNKVSGVFKGVPPVSAVSDLQIFANDTINEGADTAHYSAMPIVMTDPEKNPRVGSMILALGAVWETSPKDTQIVEFPELWSSAMDRAKVIQQQIFQTLNVNPSMVPQSTGGKTKRNQAEIAMEQQIDIMTTADAVTVAETEIFTPLVQRFAEYDHQFRDKVTTVLAYGDLGLKADMEQIAPIQLGNRYEIIWFGVETNRNAAQIQQQISWLNVLKGIPPEMHPGYRVNAVPVITRITDNIFGSRIGPLVFEKETAYTVPPELENEMMAHGLRMEVHPADDDMMHMQVHMQDLAAGDPHGTVREHMAMHQQQMAEKAKQQMMAQAQKQGGPPGGGGGPAGPQPGAMAEQPHAPKQPPGAIAHDRMPSAGATPMPRRAG